MSLTFNVCILQQSAPSSVKQRHHCLTKNIKKFKLTILQIIEQLEHYKIRIAIINWIKNRGNNQSETTKTKYIKDKIEQKGKKNNIIFSLIYRNNRNICTYMFLSFIYCSLMSFSDSRYSLKPFLHILFWFHFYIYFYLFIFGGSYINLADFCFVSRPRKM